MTVKEREIDGLVETYTSEYKLAPALKGGGPNMQSLRDAAKIEIGMRNF